MLSSVAAPQLTEATFFLRSYSQARPPCAATPVGGTAVKRSLLIVPGRPALEHCELYVCRGGWCRGEPSWRKRRPKDLREHVGPGSRFHFNFIRVRSGLAESILIRAILSLLPGNMGYHNGQESAGHAPSEQSSCSQRWSGRSRRTRKPFALPPLLLLPSGKTDYATLSARPIQRHRCCNALRCCYR